MLTNLPPVTSPVRHRLTPAETGPALCALCEWTPADVPGGGLYPGDVGWWYLRCDDAAVFLRTDDAAPVAVGFLDGPVLRVTVAPGAGPGAVQIERTLSWITAHRRLTRYYESSPAHSGTMIRRAMTGVMVRRLTRGRPATRPGPEPLVQLR